MLNDVGDGIQTGDLWCRKHFLNQVSHHHFVVVVGDVIIVRVVVVVIVVVVNDKFSAAISYSLQFIF